MLRVWQEQLEQSLSKKNGKKQGKKGSDSIAIDFWAREVFNCW